MKILYLHQYFHTPQQGGAIRSYHLAKALVEAGHEVEMITSWNHQNYHFENIDGIKVHYLPVFYENNLSYIRRAISFIRYLYRAYEKAKEIEIEIEGIDLCYTTSTPLTIGIVALFLKRFHKIKFYFEVRDLWPEAPIQMQAVKNPLLKKYLYWLEKKIYLKAEKIIALSPGMVEGIKKVVPEKEVLLIPNFSDCVFFHPEIKNPEIEKKFHSEGKFVISYFGAIGRANHLEYLIEAAREARASGLDELHFIIVGKGAQLKQVEHLVAQYNLNNVLFIHFLNKDSLKELLNVTDAAYISFADKPILQTNSPNKFFDALASGKICIINIEGWIKELIEKNNCGFYYDPKIKNAFTEKIKPYLADKSFVSVQQKNARALAEKEFSKELIVEKFLALFQ